MSKSRTNRKRNDQLRAEAASKQNPLPIEEQQRRAAVREAAYKLAYPHPHLDPHLDLNRPQFKVKSGKVRTTRWPIFLKRGDLKVREKGDK